MLGLTILTGSQKAGAGLALLLVGMVAGIVAANVGGKPIIPRRIPRVWRLMLMFFGIVLIALAVDLGVKVSVETGAERWMPSSRWWSFAMITGAIFGVVARLCRPSWIQRSFWLTLASLLAIHLLAWTIPMLNTSEWGAGLFVLVSMIEGALLMWLLVKLGFRTGSAKL